MTDRELLSEIAKHLDRWAETDRPLNDGMWREAMAALARSIRGQLESAPTPGPATLALMARFKSLVEKGNVYVSPDELAFLAEHEPAKEVEP